MKVTGPLLSLDASGSIAGTFVASKWKGRNYMRILTIPSNPRTAAQTAFRAMWKFLSQAWAGLSAPNKATWDDLAEADAISPFNAYQRGNQLRWRNYTAPSQAYPATGAGTDPTLGVPTATGGYRQATINQPITLKNDGWGILLHRGTTPAFVASQGTVIAAVPMTANATTTTYVDTPLAAGTWYYKWQWFGVFGELGTVGTEVNAVVT